MEEHSLKYSRVVTHSNSLESKTRNASFYLILVLSFLLPVFFLPFVPVQTDINTSLLLSIGLGIAILLYGISLLRSGSVTIPRNMFFTGLCLLNIVFIASALLNGNLMKSLFGFGGEIGTIAFMFFATLLFCMTFILFDTKDKVFLSYILFFLAFAFIGVHHIVRLFFGFDILTFGIFTTNISSVLGSWNNVAIFFGASTLIALLTLIMLQTSRLVRIMMQIMFGVSLFFVVLVNFMPVWIVIGLCALAYLVYFNMQSNTHDAKDTHAAKRGTIYGGIALVSACIMLFGGNWIHPYVTNTFGVSFAEVRPSWSSTMEIGRETLRENLLFGSGPNTFNEQWVKYKPQGVNETIFYNVDFSTGVAFIPTLAATTGVLGIIAFLLIVIGFAYTGSRIVIRSVAEPFVLYLLISSFATSLYLWLMLFVYTPSASMLALTFFFTGIFYAVAYQNKLLKMYEFSFRNQSRYGFFFVLVLISGLAFSTLFAFTFGKHAISRVFFAQSVAAFNQGEIEAGEQYLARALSLEPHDVIYRAATDLALYRLNQFINSDLEGLDQEEITAQFRDLLSDAITTGGLAVKYRPENYENWMKLAEVYAAVAPQPFAIEGAYEAAKEAFSEADRFNPTAPSISLLRARLDAAMGNMEDARMYIEQALQKKSNYLEAYYFLSQLEAATGNTQNAISSAESSAVLAPDNPGVFFQLGLLYYSVNNFEGAIQAFGRAVQLVPDYSNAKYFLALSLYRLERVEDAIMLFEEIQVLNPDNEEVKLIISNLRAGNSPFMNAEPPIDDKPESRTSLPIDEEQ